MNNYHKYFYNGKVRIVLFILSLICCVFLVLSSIVLMGKDTVFYDDDLTQLNSFAETNAIKEYINNDVYCIANSVTTSRKYAEINKNNAQIYLTDYNTWEQSSVSINYLEQMTNESIIDTARELFLDNRYGDEYGSYNIYSLYNYSFYEYMGTKQFLRISQADFFDIMYSYTDLNTQRMTELPKGVTVTDSDENDDEVEYGETDAYTTATTEFIADMETSDSEEMMKQLEDQDVYPLEFESDEVPVYNSLDRSVNSRCAVRYLEDEEGSGYLATINANFGDDCYIFQRDEETFLYSFDEEVIYNDAMGWVSMAVLLDADYLYIPMAYLDYTSQAALEQSILLAPQFNSIIPVFFAGMNTGDLNILSDSVYADWNFYIGDQSLYCFSYQNQKDAQAIVTSNVESTSDVDSESFSDCAASIRNNCDVIVTYDGVNNIEESYYKDAEGNIIQNNFLNKNTLKILNSLGDDFKLVLGFNINKASGNNYYWDSVLFRLCKLFDNALPIFIVAFIGLLLSFILMTVCAGVAIDENGQKKIKVCFLEKIPYECLLAAGMAIVFGLFAVFAFGISYRGPVINSIFYYGGTDYNYAMIVVSTVAVVFLYLILVEVYLSLVRRIKNHTFISRLLLVKLVKRIKAYTRSVSRRGKGAALVMVKYALVFLVNILTAIILMAVHDSSGDGFTLFIIICLVCFDIYHTLKIMKYATSVDVILKSTNKIAEGDLDEKVPLDKLSGNCCELAESVNSIGDGLHKAVEISTRDERMKAELITNVSHDIKTPLTSIINYVDLIKREKIENEKIMGYVKVLDQKSQRLKQLTEDLVEASKASTGNIELECINLNLVELLQQTIGEFDDKFAARNLTLVSYIPDDSFIIYADGRRSFRIIENLFQNAYKYAMPGTRIYLDIRSWDGFVEMTLKNVSEAPLNISPAELTERFVRGDSSRTTEGSGLGLSIAKNLTELQGGQFEIAIDGDLFRVTVTFPLAKVSKSKETEASEGDKTDEDNDGSTEEAE